MSVCRGDILTSRASANRQRGNNPRKGKSPYVTDHYVTYETT